MISDLRLGKLNPSSVLLGYSVNEQIPWIVLRLSMSSSLRLRFTGLRD